MCLYAPLMLVLLVHFVATPSHKPRLYYSQTLGEPFASPANRALFSLMCACVWLFVIRIVCADDDDLEYGRAHLGGADTVFRRVRIARCSLDRGLHCIELCTAVVLSRRSRW